MSSASFSTSTAAQAASPVYLMAFWPQNRFDRRSQKDLELLLLGVLSQVGAVTCCLLPNLRLQRLCRLGSFFFLFSSQKLRPKDPKDGDRVC
jgi:hypothetical protein